MTKIEINVKRILEEAIGAEPEEITPSARIVEDLGADSLDMVEILLAAEEAFDIALSDTEVGRLTRVSDLIDVISEKCSVGAGHE